MPSVLGKLQARRSGSRDLEGIGKTQLNGKELPLSDATYVILLMSVGVVNRMYFQTTHHHNSNRIISSDVTSRWEMILQVLSNFALHSFDVV